MGKLKLRAMYKAESWPDWVDQQDDEALCPIVGKPEDIPTFGTSKSVTRRIETSGR